MEKLRFFRKGNKAIAETLAFLMVFSAFQPLFIPAYAVPTGGFFPTPNNGYVNVSNSGSYVIGFELA